MQKLQHHYTTLETVLFNQAIAAAIPSLVEHYHYKNIFIVISHTLHRDTTIVQTLQRTLGSAIVGVFDKIRTHTPRDDVLVALAQAAELNVDVIIAIGGGSIIDAGKALQFALNFGLSPDSTISDFAQFADGRRGPRALDAARGLLPMTNSARVIAVPTTLSGAEFSNNAGVLDLTTGSKEGYRTPLLYPQAIVYDPAITVHTPAWLWLSTAIRSIDHAIEGFCAPEVYPFLEGQYLHALRLFMQSLPAVKKQGDDVAARSLNQQAVWLACCGLGRVSHGASHGIGYILGSLCGVPHGYTSCVMLPAVLEWNAKVNGERQTLLASALGDGGATPTVQLRKLLHQLGLPSRLRDVAVKQTQFAEIAKRAAQHRVVRSNPRSIQSADEVMEILHLAW